MPQPSPILASPALMPLLSADTPFFIVLNHGSGSGDGRIAHLEMQELLAEQRRRHEFFVVKDPKQLGQIAERAAQAAVRESGAVIAAGGDGTINAVAQATLPTGRPFGIVPQGTFNYTPRSQGIPLDVREATLALSSARIKPMQVGLVNDRVFLVNASLGLYPELLEDREAYKRRYGRYRAVAFWSGLMTLMRNHRQLVLEIEHDREQELLRTPALFVGNNALQLEQVGLPEAEAVQERHLAGVIVRPASTLELLWLALRGALGQLAGAERVRYFALRRMVVRPLGRRQRPLKVATDGEIHWLKPPLVFTVAPQPLLLMIPGDAQSESGG
jgi:diacylglycerol kinase family enzyme